MCADVETGLRTAAAVACEAATKMSLLALALYFEEFARWWVLQQRVLQQHRVLQHHVLLLLLLLRALQQHEVVFDRKLSDLVDGRARLCE